MSGHSKWATTKHKKAAIDSKRAKLFAKLIKNIEVAARNGGPDLDGNPTLFDAVQKAKKNSVPADNITRAVKRGGGLDGSAVNYENILYEGYAAGGVALLIECLTDNRNRAASEVRVAVTRNGGTMADSGSVARMFARKGVVTLAVQQGGTSITEDSIMEAALDAGLEGVAMGGDTLDAICDPNDLVEVRKAVEAAGMEYDTSEIVFVASFDQEVDEVSVAESVFRIIDALEDSDDVQNVFTNLDLTPEVVAALDTDE